MMCQDYFSNIRIRRDVNAVLGTGMKFVQPFDNSLAFERQVRGRSDGAGIDHYDIGTLAKSYQLVALGRISGDYEFPALVSKFIGQGVHGGMVDRAGFH